MFVPLEEMLLRVMTGDIGEGLTSSHSVTGVFSILVRCVFVYDCVDGGVVERPVYAGVGFAGYEGFFGAEGVAGFAWGPGVSL